MNEEKTTPKWGGAYPLPSGHRLFYDTSGGGSRAAIADESGKLPQDTDDGILWIDTSRPIDCGRNEILLPVIADGTNEERLTVIDAPTMLDLSSQFRWTIVYNRGGRYYNVR